jgi:hypothetical protein|nr:MAG TPA: hypothetical protein [Caudoviricetes sp.]
MVKKILKGILLWATVLIIMLLISGIDSILDHGFGTLLAWASLCLALANLCFTFITPEEFYILSGMKLIEKYMK